MSSTTLAGNADGLVTGACPAPPPPPPPPPTPPSLGQVPAMRISTAEAPAIKRPQIVSNDGYEPPAAIQNAMLTKDKKPFTYTPGMGGKLDLSQIRSPRMARRVAKNANDEGIEGPPKSAIENRPTIAPNAGPNLFVQPQVAVPVFPQNVPPPTPLRTPPTPPISRTLSNASEKQAEPTRTATKAEAKVAPITVTAVAPVTPGSPESPSTPTQVTLTKAPTPWLQNKNKPQEELPEWAKRAGASKQSPSPDSPTSPAVYVPIQTPMQTPTQPSTQPQWQQAQPKQQPIQQRPPAQQYQQQQPQVYQAPAQQPQQYQQQQKRPYIAPAVSQQTSQQERVIPIRIEDRPSVFDVKQDSGHHQFKHPSSHHQQRWGQGPPQPQAPVQLQPTTPSSQPQQTTGGAYIIPVMVESNEKRPANLPPSNVAYVQPAGRNNVVDNQSTKVVPQRGPAVAVQQVEPGPVQSRSFRVLQKITDTDPQNDVDTEQVRKLQLTEDDRVLMNKFKEQVDGDSYLHHEEDPRYRGAAIPSRAFRFLQNMTDSGEAPVPSSTPRPPSAINKKQNRNSKSFEETQANLPASEQQVPEPKKYMGSAIPSRSFRILQAMTAPESVATQENRQADYTCQTENNVPGNQQGVYFPPCPAPCPPPFWSPESGWWGCYPLPYAGVANDTKQFEPYSYHHDGTAYVYYPIYNQSYPGYAQCSTVNGEGNVYANPYPQYVATSQCNQSNVNHVHGQANSNDAIPNGLQPANVTDNRLQEHESKITNDVTLRPWGNPVTVSRTPSSNSNKDSDCTTAMNITDEEEIPEALTAPENHEEIIGHDDLDANNCPAAGLNLNVPNYTYIDTSDSSDSTDSESHSDNESLIESSKSNSSNGTTSNNTSSDTDDSDSYLAYSTGLNPHGRYEKDNEKNAPRACAKKESCEVRNGTESSPEKIFVDCVTETEDRTEQDAERLKTDGNFPHQLSVIYEDVEHADSESPRPHDVAKNRRWDEVPFETTDDPPDEPDTTTVSVSLPLRFKFSVSENNEDVTTVIVGDSTIKPERPSSKDEKKTTPQISEQRGREKFDDLSANYQVSNDTTVDFTIKRHAADGKRKVRNHACERIREEPAEIKVEKTEEPVTPHVNFTLRKNQSRVSKINCEDTVETEFTIKSKKLSVRKEEAHVEKAHSETSVNGKTTANDRTAETTDEAITKEENISITTSTNYDATVRVTQNNYEVHDYNKNVVKPEVVVSECTSTEVSRKTRTESLVRAEPPINKIPIDQEVDFARKRSNEEDREADVEEKTGKETKHLLSVQNSREETDDEDSGVTSDMSRIISEVDTDSECAPTKNIRKYQRTQTHSRLFRLLNDDTVLPECTEAVNDSASRREYLCLPLKPSTFNYDENYCSNYSSGLTSPEYSPICEQSWRRLHDTESNANRQEQNADVRQNHHVLCHQDRVSCKEDPYYQAWKAPKPTAGTDQDVLPSLAYKTLDSKKPFWAYKVNVLCPRIKSAKNVPQALLANRTNESSVPPIPKREHC